jgi:hypothetical protein
VAQARRGNQALSRAIAGSYLERFPNGLRRSEVLKLVR